jgi:glutathione synthase/RimK-type ligase-like ATP-grasp enzyme
MHIVIANCLKYPYVSTSDVAIVRALEARGHTVEAAPWNGPWQPFEAADVVVVRSTWDYHYLSDAFEDWLTRLEQPNITTYNPINLMRWNMSKTYLLELAAQGINIPQSACITPDDKLLDVMTREGLADVVVKPIQGASGVLVERVSLTSAQTWERDVRPNRPEVTWLIQAFIPEIATGEVSLVFFVGEFSHAVLKRPNEQDFRVNGQYGSTTTVTTVSAEVVQDAQKVLATLPNVPLYARVDGIVQEGGLCLLELELIEPGLFFDLVPSAAEQFADALEASLKSMA